MFFCICKMRQSLPQINQHFSCPENERGPTVHTFLPPSSLVAVDSRNHALSPPLIPSSRLRNLLHINGFKLISRSRNSGKNYANSVEPSNHYSSLDIQLRQSSDKAKIFSQAFMKQEIMILINIQGLRIDGLASQPLKELIPARDRGWKRSHTSTKTRGSMVQAALLSSQRRRRDAHGKGCQERPYCFVVETSTVSQDRSNLSWKTWKLVMEEDCGWAGSGV